MLKQCTSPSMNLKFKSTLLKSETHEEKRALSVDRAHVYSFCYVCYIHLWFYRLAKDISVWNVTCIIEEIECKFLHGRKTFWCTRWCFFIWLITCKLCFTFMSYSVPMYKRWRENEAWLFASTKIIFAIQQITLHLYVM